MDFELVSEITALSPSPSVVAFAIGGGCKWSNGKGRWRKLRGVAKIRLVDGTIHTAEVHWYEGHGIGRRELKLKLPLLD